MDEFDFEGDSIFCYPLLALRPFDYTYHSGNFVVRRDSSFSWFRLEIQYDIFLQAL